MPTYLKHYEINTWSEKLRIAACLLRYGILVNLKSGHIYYNSYIPQCKCKQLQLLRHGKTMAVESNEFMSNYSSNSGLSDEGKKEIIKVAGKITNNFPDIVLLAPLKRTIDTFELLQSQIKYQLPVKCCSYMLGINNSIWEGKKFEMLDDQNLYVFLQRECSHNVFAKVKGGDSWGDVFVRCAKILHKVNKQYYGKKVLLISQGSIYQGLKILLHQCKTPWEGYSADAMFCTKSSCKKIVGYGKVFDIC